MRPKSKKPGADLSVNKKALGELVLRAYDGTPPHTEKGGISTARETLEDSGDPVLERFVDVNRWRKFETYIPTLEEAARCPQRQAQRPALDRARELRRAHSAHAS